jgi:tRNA nucleotidyltransferase (CCA-adding enzyme)
LRRDLTINALAQTETGEIIDPYHGRRDLQQRILRHVSPAFTEDPLRVLRVARFAARLQPLGFSVAAETMELMRTMAASGELDHLVKERVWQEIEKALSSAAPATFIQVLRDCHGLQIILPEVDRLFGVPQPAKYHPEIDTGIHTLLCLQQVCLLTEDPATRYAVLVHDVGKGVTDRNKWPSHHGHEALGLRLQQDINTRLHVPREYAQLSGIVCEHHTKLHRVAELRASTLLKLLESLDALRRPERLDKFLIACEADARGRTGLEGREYPQRQYLLDVLATVLTIDIPALLGAEPSGDPKQLIWNRRLQVIGDCLQQLRH